MIVCVNLHPYIDEFVTDASFETHFTGRGLSVARQLKVLGEEVFVLGFMGSENADEYHARLNAEGIDHTFVIEEGGVRRNVKRHLAGKFTEMSVQGFMVGERAQTEILSEAETAFSGAEAVIMCGVLPRGARNSLYAELMDRVPRKVPVFLDINGEALELAVLKRPFLVKPDAYKAEEVFGKRIVTFSDVKAGAAELCESGAQSVLMSLPENGVMFFDGKQTLIANCRTDYKSSYAGVGDSMLAAAAVGALRTKNAGEILRCGVAAAAAATLADGKKLDYVLYCKMKEEIEIRQL